MALSKEDINTGNEIIALFMDGVYYEAWGNPEYNCPFPHFYFKHEETLDRKVCGDLKYHSSWDWLMQVAEKVQELGYSININLEGKKLACFTNTIIDDNQLDPTVIVDGISEKSAIYSLYTSVIQFIKWYNTQSTQQ